MLDEETLFAELGEMGLPSWRTALIPLLRKRLADGSHGRLAAWRETLAALPVTGAARLTLDTDAVTVNDGSLSLADRERIREGLLALKPWRKGPFSVCGVGIDAEWRSNLKWDRLQNAISPLAGRNVLDVGCGNGYYAFRMRGRGAARVIGVEPSLLFVMQFLAVQKLGGNVAGLHVLPLRLEDLPPKPRAFDTTFSMGVLYHRRDPAEHLRLLLDTLKPGGELVLESLVIPGGGVDVLRPPDRYARMRNVWHLPTVPALEQWLQNAGFRDVRVADVTATTPHEQRATPWMPFESLSAALDAERPGLTVEGLPAPLRAILIARAG